MTAIMDSEGGAVIESHVVPAGAEETATFLHALANRIEASEGAEVLIGMWNTGHGEPGEFCFQVVIDASGDDAELTGEDPHYLASES